MHPVVLGHDAPDPASRRLELARAGLLLDVVVHGERARDTPGINAVRARALVDTGATDICIDFRLARQLGLDTINQVTVGTMGGSVLAAIHSAVLEIPVLEFREDVPLYAFKVARSGFSLLLGRSFLADYLITYDGPNGVCTFAKPDSYLLPPDDE